MEANRGDNQHERIKNVFDEMMQLGGESGLGLEEFQAGTLTCE